MLAFYVSRENNGRKILLRARLPCRLAVISNRLPVARHARLTRLAVTAALRSVGVVPWLLALGWILFASAQEPRLLRLHGIQLVGDAARVAAVALAVAAGAALRPPRVIIPYLASAIVLTSICTMGVGAVAHGTELVRGSATIGLDVGVAALAMTLPAVATCASLVVARREPLLWTLAGAGSLVALATMVHAAAVFSLPSGLASIACFSSAAALASGHCRKNA